MSIYSIFRFLFRPLHRFDVGRCFSSTFLLLLLLHKIFKVLRGKRSTVQQKKTTGFPLNSQYVLCCCCYRRVAAAWWIYNESPVL